jgi:beta-lactamase class A
VHASVDKPDPAFAPLAERLERVAADAGIMAVAAGGRELFARQADVAFPAASVIKLPLAMALHAEAAEGALSLERRVALGALAEGSGVLRDLHDLRDLSLRDLVTLALSVSDNTATNRLIECVGFDRVNARLDAWGCSRSRLRRLMYDRDAARSGSENEMTPRESAALLLRLLRDAPGAPQILAALERNADDSLLARYLPPSRRVAHKGGWIPGVRNDVGIVWAERPVIVAGFVRGLADEAVARPILGLLGWCAYRVAGADVPLLPPELSGA